jgi:quercetin dioxygenase-like cupin family protein
MERDESDMPFFDHLISHVNYSPNHQEATPLFQSDQFTVMLIGFEPGQSVPEHPGPAGAFYVVNGEGWITVDGEQREVRTGTLVIAPRNARRSVEAKSRLTLLVSRGEAP